jgi:hypothetical protein
MKDPVRIHDLLEAYYLGNTSIAEEEELREYFRSGEFPEELTAEAELFGYFSQERAANGNKKLEDKITRVIDAKRPEAGNVFSRWKTYWISGAAAAILILITVFIDIRIQNRNPLVVETDTFEDPYLAYMEAKRVMTFVSEKMNSGSESLRNLQKLDAGLDYMLPVFSFGPGIQRLEYLNTIDKTRELISK